MFNRFGQELLRMLSRYNCTGEYDEQTGKIKVMNNGCEICTVHINGSVTCSPENLLTDEQQELYFKIQHLSDTIREYVLAYEKAPSFYSEEIGDGFKKLAEYNGIVFAAKDIKTCGFEFVTWKRHPYDDRFVSSGHYSYDYESLKKDFAIRSGLIQEKMLFENEQLENIYRSVAFTKENNDCLTYDQEQELSDIMNQIEAILSHVKDGMEAEQIDDFQMNM